MLKAVLDTNVIVSGLIKESSPAGTILKAWREDRFLLVTSEKMLLEARRVFTYPRIAKYLTVAQIARAIHNLRTYGIVTQGKISANVIKEDPADNAVLAAAVEGDADYIVSGDHHLITLGRYREILIVTPREFLSLL